MTKVNNLDRHSLLAQFHCKRNNHEGGIELSAFYGFGDCREVGKALRLEPSRGAGPGCIVRDRARQMSRYGQESNCQFLSYACQEGVAVSRNPVVKHSQKHNRSSDTGRAQEKWLQAEHCFLLSKLFLNRELQCPSS